jgi:phage terminase Nu1 subunit (DNA packaging protein)
MPHSIKPRFPLTAIHGLNNSELARRTGYALRTIQRWSTDGIPLYSADRLAIRLGVHPSTIWTDWFAL